MEKVVPMPFFRSDWTNCSEPGNSTLNPCQKCSQELSSWEALGGRQGRGATWNLVLVPYQASVIILIKKHCLKASAGDDTLWAREGFTMCCEHAK